MANSVLNLCVSMYVSKQGDISSPCVQSWILEPWVSLSLSLNLTDELSLTVELISMSNPFFTEVAVQGKYFILAFYVEMYVMAGPDPRGGVAELWKASTCKFANYFVNSSS